MTSVYIEHLLSRMREDISFLRSQELISPSDAAIIASHLPSAPFADSPVHSPVASAPSHHPHTPPKSPNPALARLVPAPAVKVVAVPQARALWDYDSGDAADLAFREGDVIEIVEEMNADWWKGRLHGSEGMFPANYVEKISAPSSKGAAPSTYTAGRVVHAPPNNASKLSYLPPPSEPLPDQQPSTSMPPQVAGLQQGLAPKPKFGSGMGGRLGTAAVGGLGFGTGSAIGAGLVNNIIF